jgi:hypothetical protein
MIPYGIIVLVLSIALVAYFDFYSKASWMAKAVVSGISIFCFASWFGWISFNPLIRLFLLVALSIFIVFYRMVEQVRAGK